MRNLALAAAAAALAVALYAAGHYWTSRAIPNRQPATTTAAESALPDLTLTDLNGEKLNTASYKGKVVVVNFWAAWCGPCTAEIPRFMALQRKYSRQGLQVIGISIDDVPGQLRAFYRKLKMNYPVVPGGEKTADAYGGVLGLPTTFVIGREGRLRAKYEGSTDFKKLEDEITALLNGTTR